LLKDREDAGRKLCNILSEDERSFDIFIGLNEGGVVVGEAASEAFDIPLQLLKVESFGLPSAKSMDLGSVTDEGTLSINPEVEMAVEVKPEYIARVADEKRFNARKDYNKYCGSSKRPSLNGKRVLIIGDGSNFISALTASVGYCKKSGAKKISVYTPVVSKGLLNRLTNLTNSVIFVERFSSTGSINEFYSNVGVLEQDLIVKILSNRN